MITWGNCLKYLRNVLNLRKSVYSIRGTANERSLSCYVISLTLLVSMGFDVVKYEKNGGGSGIGNRNVNFVFSYVVLQTPKDHSDWRKLEEAVSDD